MIVLNNVDKYFNYQTASEVQALKDVDLVIREGTITCLKGPSGSGKTTLLSLIGCIYLPTRGRVELFGKRISRLPNQHLTRYRRELTGFVYQNYNLLPYLTVAENICLPLLPLGVSEKEQKERVLEGVSQLGIRHKVNFPVDQLSGGEQQRVAIARALINKPRILLADEPTAHLDEKNSHTFLGIIEEIKGQGKTVVITSHDPLIYKHHCVDEVYEIQHGEIVAGGTGD